MPGNLRKVPAFFKIMKKESVVSLRELFKGAIINCSGFLLMMLVSNTYEAKFGFVCMIVAITVFVLCASNFSKEIDKL